MCGHLSGGLYYQFLPLRALVVDFLATVLPFLPFTVVVLVVLPPITFISGQISGALEVTR
jgi:TRAP-type mannitol/chloroaromatic compound transport system permease small subunit